VAGEGLRAGVAAAVRAADDAGVFADCPPGTAETFGAMALHALADEEPRLLTPAQALALF
jgi:hypothetical protein